jgi:phosphoserine / homoserine phosphotransferase
MYANQRVVCVYWPGRLRQIEIWAKAARALQSLPRERCPDPVHRIHLTNLTSWSSPLQIVCLDLEGVLIPEIWIEFSQRTGIPELAKTTRDEPDYDKLMRGRLDLLDARGLGLPDIQKVIAGMRPLEGAREFLDWLRGECQVVILSDTYYEFAASLMRQLGYPTLFCHELVVDPGGRVCDYRLRMQDPKRASVKALRELNFHTIAVGDSYNDITMLAEAHAGILFCPPANVAAEFPQFPVTRNYDELRRAISGSGA